MHVFLVDFFLNGHHVDHVECLSRYLLEKGHEVTFGTWAPDRALEGLSKAGVKVRYIGDGEGPLANDTLHMLPQFTQGLRNCFKTAQRENAAVVHLLYLDRAILVPLWWNDFWSKVRLPVLGTLFSPYHFIDSPNLSHCEKLYHRMVRRSLRTLLLRNSLAGLFVRTDHIKEVILRALGAEELEQRLVVVPDPLPDLVSVPGQEVSKQACRARLGLSQDHTVILFFGELRDSKGPDILLQAIKSVPTASAEILVVFAGAPAGALSGTDWRQEVRRQGLEERVRLDLGHVPNELVPVYFQAADAVVLPYRRSSLATSGVLQWAVAAHKPVIAADVGEVGNLVRRYGLGVVVEPEDPERLGNAIVEYVRRREAVDATLAERASEYISLNHWRGTSASMLAVYERAAAR